jgi:gliding motility-associated lipoprotein GldH
MQRLKNNGKRWRVALAATALIAAAACSRHANDFSQFGNIDPEGWRYTTSYVFTPEIEDSLTHGTLSLAVRHSNDYPYRNLYLEVSYWQADSCLKTDTVNVQLADIYGNWLGGGLGTSFQKADTLCSNFPMLNHSVIKVRHVMRPDVVTGVEQIGLMFYQHEQ